MPQNFNHPRNFNKPVAVAAGLSLALGMAACSSPEKEGVETPTVSATETATPIEIITVTPSATQAPEVSPTTIPDLPVDPEPSFEMSESKFVVDYESFNDWENKTRLEKYEICKSFYETNGAISEVVPSTENTGEEIIDIYSTRYNAAWELNKDMSNDANGEVALKLVDCLTKPRADNGSSAKNLLDTSFDYARGNQIDVPNSPIDRVTRYSSELISYIGQISHPNNVGVADEGIWHGKTIEYVKKTELGELILQSGFEWDTSTKDWAIVDEYSGDVALDYGDTPPIVLDSSRANAPLK